MAKRELSLECDYVHEARCQERARSLVAAHPDLRDHVSVPAVIPELSSSSILASEYVPGSHIDKVVPCLKNWPVSLSLLPAQTHYACKAFARRLRKEHVKVDIARLHCMQVAICRWICCRY